MPMTLSGRVCSFETEISFAMVIHQWRPALVNVQLLIEASSGSDRSEFGFIATMISAKRQLYFAAMQE